MLLSSQSIGVFGRKYEEVIEDGNRLLSLEVQQGLHAFYFVQVIGRGSFVSPVHLREVDPERPLPRKGVPLARVCHHVEWCGDSWMAFRVAFGEAVPSSGGVTSQSVSILVVW